MAFSTEKLLPAVWIFMKIPAATVVPNDGYPIVICQSETKQVSLIVPAAAAQTSSLRSVSFVGHARFTLAATLAQLQPAPRLQPPETPQLLGLAFRQHTALRNYAKPQPFLC